MPKGWLRLPDIPKHPLLLPAVRPDGQKTQDFQIYLEKVEALLSSYATDIATLQADLAALETETQLSQGLQYAKGQVDGHTLVNKFGHNSAVGTTFVPVANGGVYQTPTPSNAVQLRIKAGGNANDTAAGTGARAVTLIGLDQNANEVTETLATAGASASSYTTTTFMRLYRAYVSDSGTYANATAGSHAGDIVIEDGTNDWLTIDSTDFPRGQSEVACYSVPTGFSAYVSEIDVEVETTKNVDVIFFVRDNILDETAGYPAMRSQQRFSGLTESISKEFDYPIRYTGPCDIGFMAKVSTGTARVNAQFDFVLVDDSV